MDRIFDLGSRLGNMAQNGPKSENITPPSVFELGLCHFQNVITKPYPKTLLDQNFDFGPRFENMALKSQNGPKFENITPPSVLKLGLCKFQNVIA